MLEPSDVSDLVEQHDLYFEGRRDELRELRRLYMTRFWQNESENALDGILRTEVPKAYAVVESYLGSLYAKNPAVRVEPDLRDRGNPEVAPGDGQPVPAHHPGAARRRHPPGAHLPVRLHEAGAGGVRGPVKRVSRALRSRPGKVIVDATACSLGPATPRRARLPHAGGRGGSERYGKESTEFRPRAYSKWIEPRPSPGRTRMRNIDSNAGAVPDEGPVGPHRGAVRPPAKTASWCGLPDYGDGHVLPLRGGPRAGGRPRPRGRGRVPRPPR